MAIQLLLEYGSNSAGSVWLMREGRKTIKQEGGNNSFKIDTMLYFFFYVATILLYVGNVV